MTGLALSNVVGRRTLTTVRRCLRTHSHLLELGVSRTTNQQRTVLAVLNEAPGPLTAHEVFDRARASLKGIGLATVYRNLGSLESKGEIVSVHLPQDPVRFEPAGRQHHHHFRCKECLTVFELRDDCPVPGLEGTTLPGGLKVTGHELLLLGICSACQSSPANNL